MPCKISAPVPIKRRGLIIGAAVASATLAIRGARAQTDELPSFEITLGFLETPGTARLLLSQFAFARELAVLALVQLDTAGLDNPEDLDRFFFEAPQAGVNEVFRVLAQLADPGNPTFREQATVIIDETIGSLGDRTQSHQSMVQNYTAIVQEAGFNSDNATISDAIDSLTHVERVLEAVAQGLGLCDVFPFSTRRFCGVT